MTDTISFVVPALVADAIALDDITARILVTHPGRALRCDRGEHDVVIICDQDVGHALAAVLRDMVRSPGDYGRSALAAALVVGRLDTALRADARAPA